MSNTVRIFAGALAILTPALNVHADDWPQWRGPSRDGVWREAGVVERFGSPQLTPKWKSPIGGGYGGPAAAAGKVYVMDRQREAGTERVVCLNAATGEPVWKHEYKCDYKGITYDAGPRCTPTVDGDRVYAVGATGRLSCLRTDNGQVIWEKDYVKDFGARLPTWGMAAHPLVDGDRLIACVGGADGAGVVALNKATGKEIWRALSVRDIGYSPPMIYAAGQTRQLIIWHPEAVCSLDPATGKLHWQQPFHTDMGVSIITSVYDRPWLFVSQSWGGPLMLELAADASAPRVAWQLEPGGNVEEEMVNSLMSTPILREGHIYAVALYGALRCLKESDGSRVWETYQATGHGRWWNAFLTPNGDRVFIANEQGELIIARLSPKGYEEISRARLIEPTQDVGRRKLVWSHPAYANRCVYARNDKEIVCADLAK